MMDKKTLWNKASVCGLILGAATLALSLLQSVSGAFGVLVWLVKLVGCIWLLRFFMKKAALEDESLSGADLFRLGTVISLLSAVIYAGSTFIITTLIDPSMYTEAFEELIPVFEQQMPSAEIDALMEMLPEMPKYVLIFNLVYCTLFGMVVAAVSKNSLVKDNPF